MTMVNLTKQQMLTAKILRERVCYDPETGRLTWKACANPKFVGKDIGFQHHTYRKVAFPEGQFFLHRLAWLHFYGEWPKDYIDHANGNPLDNRIANLRACTHRQNIANRRPSVVGKLKGVTRSKNGKRWRAQIADGVNKAFLGTFDTPEEAHAAYAKRAVELHGEFARLT